MKTTLYYCLFFFLFQSFSINACPQSIHLQSQHEVDQIFNWFPGCTSFKDVTVQGLDITNLDAILEIRSISAQFKILNTSITTLPDFPYLDAIGTKLVITNNQLMTQIEGFSETTFIGGEFEVGHNNELISIGSFKKLNHLAAIFNLHDNLKLETVQDFPELIHVDSSFEVSNNPSLLELAFFNKISRIKGDLVLINNPNFNGYKDFQNIQTINGTLYISNLGKTDDLKFLINLSTLGNFSIENNLYLERLQGPPLSEIKGSVSIKGNAKLVSLQCLRNIEHLFGNVKIQENPLFNSFNGLHNIKSIEGLFIIENLPLITDLSSLTRLSSVGNLHIESNKNLKSLEGFVITEVNESIYINENKRLIELSGLEHLKSVANISIANNDSLTSVEALKNLTIVKQKLNIYNNDQLLNLNGLEGIMIAQEIRILYNHSLKSIEALDGICPLRLKSIRIVDNQNLSVCNNSFLCDYLDLGGNIIVHSNNEGCNDRSELSANCPLNDKSIHDISLYPNPAHSYVTIECKEDMDVGSIFIINQLGEVVLKQEAYYNTIDLTGLPPGGYIFQIELYSDFGSQLLERRIIIK